MQENLIATIVKIVQALLVGDSVYKTLFEHEVPTLDGAEQGVFERTDVYLKPALEHFGLLQFGHLLVQVIIRVYLQEARYMSWFILFIHINANFDRQENEIIK